MLINLIEMKLVKKKLVYLFCVTGAFLISLYLNGSIYRRIQNSDSGSYRRNLSKASQNRAYKSNSLSWNNTADVKYKTYTINLKQRRQALKIKWSKIQMKVIIDALPENGNLLVWGIGRNSRYLHTCTRGKVIFIDEDRPMREVDTMFEKYPLLKVYLVHYKKNTVSSFQEYMNNPEIQLDLDLSGQLPVFVTQTHWHVIVVDVHSGCCPSYGNRRYQSIYTSGILAREGTHIFVNGFQPNIEHKFSMNVFGKLLGVITRRSTKTTRANKLAHFIFNSNKKRVISHGSNTKPNTFVTSRLISGNNRTENWMILVTLNNKFFDFFKNWLWHFKQINIHIPIYVIAEDRIVFDRLAKLSDDSFEVQRSDKLSVNKSADYGTLLFKKMVSMRPTYILTYLKKGTNIIYSDLDTVWLQNPLPYLKGNYDIWSQLDSTNKFCTGFLAIKSNNVTLNFMRKWQNALRKHPALNQPVFNKLVESYIKIKALDSRRFPSGKQYFNKLSRKERAEVVIVHNNWVVGHDRKVKRFQKVKLWVSDIDP